MGYPIHKWERFIDGIEHIYIHIKYTRTYICTYVTKYFFVNFIHKILRGEEQIHTHRLKERF